MRWYSLLIATLLLVSGCTATRSVPSTGTDFTLDGCTPLLNCASSESSVDLYEVPRITLTQPLDADTWQRILDVATGLPGAELDTERFGYAKLTCYSDTFRFPDYFEILVSSDQRHLEVRSQSLLGIYDLGVNHDRIETFRQQLQNAGLAKAP